MEPSWSHPESLVYHLYGDGTLKSFKFSISGIGSAFNKCLEDA